MNGCDFNKNRTRHVQVLFFRLYMNGLTYHSSLAIVSAQMDSGLMSFSRRVFFYKMEQLSLIYAWCHIIAHVKKNISVTIL